MSEQDQPTSAQEAVAPQSAEAAASFPPARIAALTALMRRGRTSEAEAEIRALAAERSGGDPAPVLAAVVAEPELQDALAPFEQWLEGTADASSATPLGAWWAQPAAGLDMATATSEARLYIDAYPKEGLIVGDLEARATDWLVRRIAMSFDSSPHIPVMREAIAMLVVASRPAFPTTSASLHGVKTDIDDAVLWHSLIRQIVQSEMQRSL